MDPTLSREVRLLKIYSALATAILSVLLLSAAISQGQDAKPVFKEIDVERINIVEADGQLRMVISNQARQHPGIMDGKIVERSAPRPPGMIFFNHLGDEMGGLVFGDNGGDGHFGSLTFDKVRNDQTIGFRHLESDNGQYHTGLEMWQQPDISGQLMIEQFEAAQSKTDPAEREAALQALVDRHELTSRRLFLGKGRNDISMLALYDIEGRARIRMQVAADGTATLEFLDADGEVVHRIPE
jgi:hypothetical protein